MERERLISALPPMTPVPPDLLPPPPLTPPPPPPPPHRTGWELATLQNPPALHLALTLPTSRNAQQFVDDLRAAVKAVGEQPDKFKGGTAGIYGTAASVPSAFLEESVSDPHPFLPYVAPHFSHISPFIRLPIPP